VLKLGKRKVAWMKVKNTCKGKKDRKWVHEKSKYVDV
jgi:hypothetical protein